MGKRKAFFSIYILLFTILGGVLHGPLMALAGHDEGEMTVMEPQYMHLPGHQDQKYSEKLASSDTSGSPAMECCQESPTSAISLISIERKVEVSDSVSEQPFSMDDFCVLPKSDRADFSDEYFSPPEKTILASVVKIE